MCVCVRVCVCVCVCVCVHAYAEVTHGVPTYMCLGLRFGFVSSAVPLYHLFLFAGQINSTQNQRIHVGVLLVLCRYIILYAEMSFKS